MNGIFFLLAAVLLMLSQSRAAGREQRLIEQRLGSLDLVGVRRHDDRGEVEAHVCERLAQIAHGEPVVPDVQPDRGHTVLEVVEDGSPGDGDVGVVMPLADVPRSGGVAHRATAGERHPAR